MYLSKLFIENFRIFGSRSTSNHLDLTLQPGLNILIGENDSGKSAVLDAIRLVLLTTSFDYIRITEHDFHLEQAPTQGATGTKKGPAQQATSPPDPRALDFTIRCSFTDLNTEEISQFLEWMSADSSNNPVLHITLKAVRKSDSGPNAARRPSYPFTIHSGSNGDGPRIEGEIREFLRTTYLKPLRDAEAELTAGRNSRLSQILENHPNFIQQRISDYDPAKSEPPQTLTGIFRQAEARVVDNPVIQETKERLNEQYLREFSLGDDLLRGKIGFTGTTDLRQILEKLELWLESSLQGTLARTQRGLGYNNILFMATELLLLGATSGDSFPMLLIEEPEAHLHPQLQMRLMDFLERKSSREGEARDKLDLQLLGLTPTSKVIAQDPLADSEQSKNSNQTSKAPQTQILLTSHSPNLASKAELRSMTLMCRGHAYPLAESATRLSSGDYRFLERFLDVTKSNLFFAKAVLMVEGDAENILIPTIADLLGRSLSRFGVSIVNVGHIGFFRYSKILQSSIPGREVPVRVACLADRDIIPDAASIYVERKKDKNDKPKPTFASDFRAAEIDEKVASKKKNDADNVKTFVSESWTFEHDLALGGLSTVVHTAIKAAKRDEYLDSRSGATITFNEMTNLVAEAKQDLDDWQVAGKSKQEIAALIYQDMYKKLASKAVVAQIAAQILADCKFPKDQPQTYIPRYILEALEFLTGPGLLSNNATQTKN